MFLNIFNCFQISGNINTFVLRGWSVFQSEMKTRNGQDVEGKEEQIKFNNSFYFTCNMCSECRQITTAITHFFFQCIAWFLFGSVFVLHLKINFLKSPRWQSSICDVRWRKSFCLFNMMLLLAVEDVWFELCQEVAINLLDILKGVEIFIRLFTFHHAHNYKIFIYLFSLYLLREFNFVFVHLFSSTS